MKLQSAQKNLARRRDILKQRIDEKFGEAREEHQLSSLSNLFVENRSSTKVREEKLITLDGVNFGYDVTSLTSKNVSNQYLLKDISLSITSTDRIALIGQNGSGKSTLLKLIVGDLEPTSGNVSKKPLRLLYFPQNAAMDLLMRKDIRDNSVTEIVQGVASGKISLNSRTSTVCEHLQSSPIQENVTRDTISVLEARTHLGKFGLVKQMVSRPIGSLSTGERTRVYLSLLMLQFAFGEKKGSPPDLLILDEISDNLDVDTVESLIDAFSIFEGGILCVSHEHSDFLDRFCTVQWELRNGGIRTEFKNNCDK